MKSKSPNTPNTLERSAGLILFAVLLFLSSVTLHALDQKAMAKGIYLRDFGSLMREISTATCACLSIFILYLLTHFKEKGRLQLTLRFFLASVAVSFFLKSAERFAGDQPTFIDMLRDVGMLGSIILILLHRRNLEARVVQGNQGA